MKNKKFKTLSVIVTITLLFNLLNINNIYAYTDSEDAGWLNWERLSTPLYNTANSYWNNGNNSNSDIIQRIKGSYSYRERLPKVQNAKWEQQRFYSFLPDGSERKFDFSNITYDGVHTPDGQMGVTHWYNSPYGVFLDYETRYLSNPNASICDWKSPTNQTPTRPTSAVQDSIDYSRQIYPHGSKAVYLATAGADLADAKTASVICRKSDKRYPVLLNYTKTLSQDVKQEIRRLGARTLYILGGEARFDVLAGMTEGCNLIRAGGLRRDNTAELIYHLPSQMEEANYRYNVEKGLIIDGPASERVNGYVKDKIIEKLQKEFKYRDGNNIANAAQYAMDMLGTIGSKTSESSNPALILGVDFNGYKCLWVCYWSEKTQGYVYQYILNGYIKYEDSSVTVEHRDIDTNKMIAPSKYENVEVSSEEGVAKTYNAKDINKYTYNSCKVISGGRTSTGSNPANIMVKGTGENKVIFYYKKDKIDSGGSGEIKFTPHETEWTNQGKTNEGEGKYSVDVEYVGDKERTLEGVVTIHHDEPQKPLPPGVPGGQPRPQPDLIYDYEVPFEVKYNLDSIEVSGDTTSTIKGIKGTVGIEKQGENLKLQGKGIWGEPQYTLPSIGKYEKIVNTVLPQKPDNVNGESGEYDLDWERTKIETTAPEKKWINSPVPYSVKVDVNDNLSGIGYGEKIIVKDSSHYANNAETIIPGGKNTSNIEVKLDDGIYDIEVKANDVAGNEHNEKYSTYYVDGNKPGISFNMFNKVFSEENDAIRKSSILGNGDSYFGKVTVEDNLSGVSSIEYKWSYGSNASDENYSSIYTSPTTYIDRYSEKVVKEIEKPVGDNLYLHVKAYDVAGNYTYAKYGPYEDPVRLKNFQVTDIRDPRWISVFWNDTEYKEYKETTFGVDKMPIDRHPQLSNAIPKKGYAFYFDITSEYLYRDEDRIEIDVKYYYVKGNEKKRVDCYYNSENNPLTLVGSEADKSILNLNTERYGDVIIGNYNKLILTRGVRKTNGREWKDFKETKGWKDEIQYIDGKEQWWYGKYYIPASSFFVLHGEEPTPENKLKGGNVLINFEIVGYKNGIETLSTDRIYNYNNKEWLSESGEIKNPYGVGDVILYNGKYGVNSDTSVRVIH